MDNLMTELHKQYVGYLQQFSGWDALEDRLIELNLPEWDGIENDEGVFCMEFNDVPDFYHAIDCFGLHPEEFVIEDVCIPWIFFEWRPQS